MKLFDGLLSSKGSYSTHEEHIYYSKSLADRSAIDYRHLDRYIHSSLGRDFFRGKTVLDVGAGEGVYSAWIADRGGARRVVGLELTEHRIRRSYEAQLSNLTFVCKDILQEDCWNDSEQFDVVFMNLVLHHLRFALPRAVQNMVKFLRPGGVFAAIEPNSYSPFAVIAHALHDRSVNEGILFPHTIRAALTRLGLGEIKIGYFWRDRSWARNPIAATSFWITAEKGAR